MNTRWRIAVDTGGTFTDCIGVDPQGNSRSVKVLSSGQIRGTVRERINAKTLRVSGLPDQPAGFWEGFRVASEGGRWEVESAVARNNNWVFSFQRALPETLVPGSTLSLETGEEAPVLGIRLLTGKGPREPFPEANLRLGTTKGTNALLEGKGNPPLFVVTKGFGDLLKIRDQRRPELFALNVQTPEALPGPVFELDSRQDKQGAILEDGGLEALRQFLKKESGNLPRTAAVSLIHGYRNAYLEDRVAEVLEEAGISYVAKGSSLSPFIGYLTRSETAVVDAYLGPLMEAYLEAVRNPLPEGGSFRVMTSAGGLLSGAHYRPKDSLLSGPAGGVVGVAALGRRTGRRQLLALDMGGTSTDVSRYSGRKDLVDEHQVGPARLVAPALRIETVAAGGGSICDFDGHLLQVGPESAGADPGPACYGRGGPLTLTDVNLLLGRFSDEHISIPIHREAAEKALAMVQKKVREEGDQNLSREALLEGFLDLANERMSQAMQRISVREGFDPKAFCLVAFGGAGGQHACAIADRLGIGEIMAPAEAGVLSAFGIQEATLEAQQGKQILQPWNSFQKEYKKEAAQLRKEVEQKLEAEGWSGEEEVLCESEIFLRFQGQDLEIPVSTEADSIEEAFGEAFKKIFGYLPEDRVLEVSRLRLRLEVAAGDPEEESFEPVEEYDVSALQVLPDPFSSLVVEPGWRLYRGSAGTRLLKRDQEQDSPRPRQNSRSIIGKTLITQRLRNLVEAMGTQLRRTALSTNIKERLDFSCALLDGAGRLVVNAPHIPVHLGALGLCIRKVSESVDWRPGDIVVVNHPHYGGSHLPDITTIAPVFEEGAPATDAPLAFLANRAHHAEVGGLLPGSMPPHAKNLAEEGVVIPPTVLFREGKSYWEDLRAIFQNGAWPSRRVEENLADLHAQVASLRKGGEEFQVLLDQIDAEGLEAHLAFLSGLAEDEVRRPLREAVGQGIAGSTELDDGSRIEVSLRPKGDQICIDFTNTSPTHSGNLNATPAIINSVLLYVLRLLVGNRNDLPLNEGFLKSLCLNLPEGMLNPHFPKNPEECPAVVGGNVEVSQRLVDLLLRTLKLSAGSQATMNNILFGNSQFSHYETLGGGSGAGPDWAGASGTHVHMSNTAITDPEILEFRFPVRLWQFALRADSGGRGQYAGGNGLVREYEFLEALQVSLLTQQRDRGPPGLEGGRSGAPGRQLWIPAEGDKKKLKASDRFDASPGDRLILETPGGGGWGTPET